jgi:hypothetical protein
MAGETDGDHATMSELLDAATKLDHLADEMEQTGHTIGGAAAGAAAAMPGFSIASASMATCGHLNSSVAETVRQIREQANQLRRSAAEYSDLDSQAQKQVTIA